MGPDSHLQDKASSHPEGQPGAGIASGPLLARLNGRLVQLAQQPPKDFSGRGHELIHLLLAAVDLADFSYTEISAQAVGEGPELIRAVDRIIDGAQRYFDAETPLTERHAAMACARALEGYGLALMAHYGRPAEVAHSHLLALVNRMLGAMMGPVSWN